MVTFNNAGRYGNWFFECCTMLAYALKHGLEFTVPSQTGNPVYNPVYRLHLVNPNYNPRLPRIDLWENGHAYQELPFEESWRDKNIVIQGYRQSEKYFKDYRNQILYLLDYPYEKRDGYVAVHVRRGDYLQLPQKHPPVTKQWYEKAMSLFPDYRYKFYSDDIRWCMDEFGGRKDCEFSGNKYPEADIIDMSWCEHNICSASTFAWAGMWLNRNEEKRVYFPEKWFQDGWDGLDTKDILPEWVHKI